MQEGPGKTKFRPWKKTTVNQPRLVYPAKLSFLNEEEIKTLHKEKLKELVTTKLTLQKVLKGLLHIEETRVRQEDSGKNKPFEQAD
jgi:hypothetical protein